MSTEVEMSTADVLAENAALRAQLLLAQADAERMMNAIRYATQSDALDQRLRGWNVLCQMAHAEHPGQALVAELAAARMANHIMYTALGQIDKHRVGACADASWDGTELEPCEECGEMRDIASAALVAELAAARAEIERLRTIVEGELPAVRMALRVTHKALDQIDKHRVGAYMTDGGDDLNPEPCLDCGDMRDIASAALALVRKAGAP